MIENIYAKKILNMKWEGAAQFDDINIKRYYTQHVT